MQTPTPTLTPQNLGIIRKARKYCRSGIVSKFKKILNSPHIDPNDYFCDAAGYGKLSILQMLHATGKIHKNNYSIAMSYACKHGHLQCIKWLFKFIDCYFSFGIHYSEMALCRSHLECANWILKRTGYTLDLNNALRFALSHGNVQGIRWLLDNGAEINSDDLITIYFRMDDNISECVLQKYPYLIDVEDYFQSIRIRRRVAKYKQELIETATVLSERPSRIIDRTQNFASELIDTVYHPDRIGKLISKYGINVLGVL